jgi:hypothetical protein
MRTPILIIGSVFAGGCSDVEDPHDHAHEHELITTVLLSFEASSGEVLEASFYDPMDGSTPSADTVNLLDGKSYTLSISFWNELEDPAEDLTGEIEDEGEEHQIFLYGDAVLSPAGTSEDPLLEAAYADTDENGLDLGLEHEIEVLQTGTGTLSVLLRHMPEENDEPVKSPDLASEFATDGASALPGDTDVAVDFSLEIN